VEVWLRGYLCKYLRRESTLYFDVVLRGSLSEDWFVTFYANYSPHD
jgi:hypothetical protein